jgi:hypothetical protein
MAEPLFGTVAPIWSAVPLPGLTWFQTPMAGAPTMGAISMPPGTTTLGNGMMAGVPVVPTSGPITAERYGSYEPHRAIGLAGSGSAFGAGPSSFGTTAGSVPLSPFNSPDITAGVTAPALVAAIAMKRGQPAGPTSDQEIEDFIYDALDLLPGSMDVEIRCDGGRMSLMGAVSQKRLKRDIGEIAWAIPAINDVQNNITIAPRRRARAHGRETETPAVAGRKTA